MSRNYDNWERLVAAVVKREQIWQLCHQDSFSTISGTSDYSSDLELGFRFSSVKSPAPVSLRSYIDTFKAIQLLREGDSGITTLAELLHNVQGSDQQYFAAGSKAVTKLHTALEVAEDEFERQMIVIGNCRHENVVTPWAYYYSQTTKLVVYNYHSKGSVFDMLHGKSMRRPNWKPRARIAIGAARGIAHIHTQCGGKLSHGNIKSSNIFVDSQWYGCVSDFGLELNKPSQKSDVYSFGLLLVELVTSESPTQASYVVDRLRCFEPSEWKFRSFQYKTLLLVDEVAVLKEGSCVYVDEKLMHLGMRKYLRRTLEIAKRCLALLPEDRPTMSQVVRELEKVRASVEAEQTPELIPPLTTNLGTRSKIWHRFLRFRR